MRSPDTSTSVATNGAEALAEGNRPGMEINGVAHLMLTVRDMRASRPFYRRLLAHFGLIEMWLPPRPGRRGPFSAPPEVLLVDKSQQTVGSRGPSGSEWVTS